MAIRINEKGITRPKVVDPVRETLIGIAIVGYHTNKVHYVDREGRPLCGNSVRGMLFGDQWFDSYVEAEGVFYGKHYKHVCKVCRRMSVDVIQIQAESRQVKAEGSSNE